MGIKSQNYELATTLSTDQVRVALQPAFRKARLSAIETGPLDPASGAEVEFLAEGAGFTGLWAVQVYIFDDDANSRRIVEFVALGDGGFARAMGGARNTTSFGKSQGVVEKAIELLRAADAGLVLVGSASE